MLETASAAQRKAMTKLDKIREKQKQVGMKTHKSYHQHHQVKANQKEVGRGKTKVGMKKEKEERN